MTDVLDAPSDRPIRIAVIGNSNSAMRDSFPVILARDKGFAVENLSIGATPNVLLLDILATADDLSHDFIIVETAVMDAHQVASGAYPMELARNNFRLFIESILSRTNAKLILLAIPTRIVLLEPNSHKIEEMYTSLAEEYNIPILNLYELFREMIGDYSKDSVQRLSGWAPMVAGAFGIPRHAAYDLSWSALRKPHLASNSFAISGFTDHLHMSRSMQRLVADLLADWIGRLPSTHKSPEATPKSAMVRASSPNGTGQEWTTRQSSLMKRRLLCLAEGGTTKYECPSDYVAAGLFLNRSQTSGFIKLESAIGSVVLDCRFVSHPLPWVGLVVPIIDPIGGGEITLTICKHEDASVPIRRLPDTHAAVNVTGAAEVAEIVLIKREAKSDNANSQAAGYDRDLSIQRSAEALAICNTAYGALDAMIDGLGEIGFGFSKGLSAAFMHLMKEGPMESEVSDRARLLLLTGNAAAALQLMRQSVASGNSDPALVSRCQTLSAFLDALGGGA